MIEGFNLPITEITGISMDVVRSMAMEIGDLFAEAEIAECTNLSMSFVLDQEQIIATIIGKKENGEDWSHIETFPTCKECRYPANPANQFYYPNDIRHAEDCSNKQSPK